MHHPELDKPHEIFSEIVDQVGTDNMKRLFHYANLEVERDLNGAAVEDYDLDLSITVVPKKDTVSFTMGKIGPLVLSMVEAQEIVDQNESEAE